MARWGRQPCSLPRVIGGTCVTFLGFLRLALFQCDRLLFPGKLGRCLPFLLNCKHCLFLRKTQRLLRGGRPASASCVAAAPVSTTNTWAAGACAAGSALTATSPLPPLLPHMPLCDGSPYGDAGLTSWVTETSRPAAPAGWAPARELGCVRGPRPCWFLWLRAKTEYFHPSLQVGKLFII